MHATLPSLLALAGAAVAAILPGPFPNTTTTDTVATRLPGHHSSQPHANINTTTTTNSTLQPHHLSLPAKHRLPNHRLPIPTLPSKRGDHPVPPPHFTDGMPRCHACLAASWTGPSCTPSVKRWCARFLPPDPADIDYDYTHPYGANPPDPKQNPYPFAGAYCHNCMAAGYAGCGDEAQARAWCAAAQTSDGSVTFAGVTYSSGDSAALAAGVEAWRDAYTRGDAYCAGCRSRGWESCAKGAEEWCAAGGGHAALTVVYSGAVKHVREGDVAAQRVRWASEYPASVGAVPAGSTAMVTAAPGAAPTTLVTKRGVSLLTISDPGQNGWTVTAVPVPDPTPTGPVETTTSRSYVLCHHGSGGGEC